MSVGKPFKIIAVTLKILWKFKNCDNSEECHKIYQKKKTRKKKQENMSLIFSILHI